MATKKMDLDRDYNINGVQYNKGEGVEVDSKHVTAINDIKEGNDAYAANATVHHGAVPAPRFPEEATAQTPTRPLAGPEMRQAAVVEVKQDDQDLFVLDDKRNAKKVEDKDEAEKVNSEEVEKGQTFDNEDASGASAVPVK